MSLLKRNVPVPKGARTYRYFDTVTVEQNQATLNPFQGAADGGDNKSNYDQNPFPGELYRIIYGVSIQPMASVLRGDPGVVQKTLNALKYGSIVLQADSDRKQLLHGDLGDHIDFNNIALQSYSPDAADEATQLAATLPNTGGRRLDDPFVIAPNQTLRFNLNFENAGDFPNSSTGIDGSGTPLELKAIIYTVEMTKKMYQDGGQGGLSSVEA